MKLAAGRYFIGDLGCVLPSDELRLIFWDLIRYGKTSHGFREPINFVQTVHDEVGTNFYWLANLPNLNGTLYGKDGSTWGFDWKIFGCAPVEIIENEKSYAPNIVEFSEPFECSHTEDLITIGHLNFTFKLS